MRNLLAFFALLVCVCLAQEDTYNTFYYYHGNCSNVGYVDYQWQGTTSCDVITNSTCSTNSSSPNYLYSQHCWGSPQLPQGSAAGWLYFVYWDQSWTCGGVPEYIYGYPDNGECVWNGYEYSYATCGQGEGHFYTCGSDSECAAVNCTEDSSSYYGFYTTSCYESEQFTESFQLWGTSCGVSTTGSATTTGSSTGGSSYWVLESLYPSSSCDGNPMTIFAYADSSCYTASCYYDTYSGYYYDETCDTVLPTAASTGYALIYTYADSSCETSVSSYTEYETDACLNLGGGYYFYATCGSGTATISECYDSSCTSCASVEYIEGQCDGVGDLLVDCSSGSGSTGTSGQVSGGSGGSSGHHNDGEIIRYSVMLLALLSVLVMMA